MKWSDWEKYLKAEHLGGKPRVVTIVEITIEEVHGQAGIPEQKPVLWFKETKKGLVVSNVNRRTLSQLFGDDAGACVGQRITLEAVSMKVANRMTYPIRISAAPAATQHAMKMPADSQQDAVQPGPAAPATSRAPGQAPAAPESASDSAAADFEGLPSQGAALRERVKSASQPPLLDDAAAGAAPAGEQPRKRKAATVDPAAIHRWQEATEDFANEFPRFRIRGSDQVDRLTLLYLVNEDLHTPRVTLSKPADRCELPAGSALPPG